MSEGPDVRLGDIRDAGSTPRPAAPLRLSAPAALIAIPYSYVAPESFVSTNAVGTLNVLGRSVGMRSTSGAVTSEVYGTLIGLDREITRFGRNRRTPPARWPPINWQSHTTGAGVPVMVLRPFNTYGPRQSARAVLLTILTQLIAGQTEGRSRSNRHASGPDLVSTPWTGSSARAFGWARRRDDPAGHWGCCRSRRSDLPPGDGCLGNDR
jgi:UDP-glucose 4-epimerase